MSDLQTSMGDDILQIVVCLRDGKEAPRLNIEQLKAMYPEEANNVALDIKTKLGELALQLGNIKPGPALSILNRNRMSLCLLRTLRLPRVMTATGRS
jgi:hypothetical protein